jgi:mannan endo-1,4-beta-mannosidase
MFADVVKVHGNELPIVLHECGPLPDPDNSFKDDAAWSWWMIWHTRWLTEHDPAELKRIYNHEAVLTLDKLPKIMSYDRR